MPQVYADCTAVEWKLIARLINKTNKKVWLKLNFVRHCNLRSSYLFVFSICVNETKMILLVTLVVLGISILAAILLCILKRPSFRQQLKQLNGRVVVITGGSLGIGRSLALKCFENGANVIVIARNEQNLQKVKGDLESKRVNEVQKVVTKQADVTSLEQVNRVFDEIVGEFKQIDYLVNCAGKSVSNAFDDAPIGEFEFMMNLNYFGTLHPTKYVAKLMKKQRSGNIVIVSSIAGLVGLHGFSAYSASKFALVGLAQCLHMELKSFNIHVTCCFPPDTDTPGFEEEEKTKVGGLSSNL